MPDSDIVVVRMPVFDCERYENEVAYVRAKRKVESSNMRYPLRL